MTDLQIYIEGLKGVFSNFWLAMVVGLVLLIKLWRWEQIEDKRLAQAAKRDNLKRAYNQEHFVSRH